MTPSHFIDGDLYGPALHLQVCYHRQRSFRQIVESLRPLSINLNIWLQSRSQHYFYKFALSGCAQSYWAKFAEYRRQSL